jgi:single-stranded-DNA-specific exonuclease
LPLTHITPDLLDLVQSLEPFGSRNPEPVFAARSVRLTAPPRILKDKHVKLRLSCFVEARDEEPVLMAAAGRADSATVRQTEKREGWKKSVTYDALGWHMAEAVQQANLLAGDRIDIAFSLQSNDHDEYGGLEMSLRDFHAGS